MFSERNIAWGGLAKQYAATPGYSSPSDAIPPPNWAEQYPDGYTEEMGFPDLAENEHFQVWMRVAAFPTFRKLWGRNDNDVMTAGTYRILINMSPLSKIPSPAPILTGRLILQTILSNRLTVQKLS